MRQINKIVAVNKGEDKDLTRNMKKLHLQYVYQKLDNHHVLITKRTNI
jgi:hypothetical protein